jgi:hypothetical protein
MVQSTWPWAPGCTFQGASRTNESYAPSAVSTAQHSSTRARRGLPPRPSHHAANPSVRTDRRMTNIVPKSTTPCCRWRSARWPARRRRSPPTQRARRRRGSSRRGRGPPGDQVRLGAGAWSEPGAPRLHDSRRAAGVRVHELDTIAVPMIAMNDAVLPVEIGTMAGAAAAFSAGSTLPGDLVGDCSNGPDCP